MSMTKFVLLMVLCSELAVNQCKIIPTPTVLFDDYSSCIVYGYDYSHKFVTKSFTYDQLEKFKVIPKYTCTPIQQI